MTLAGHLDWSNTIRPFLPGYCAIKTNQMQVNTTDLIQAIKSVDPVSDTIDAGTETVRALTVSVCVSRMNLYQG